MNRRILSALLAFIIIASPLALAKGEVDTNFITPVVAYGDTGSALVHQKVTSDGSAVVTNSSTPFAQKITQPDASNSYFAMAAVGTAQATAAWQAYKMTTSGTSTTITWADGNANFDNVATDLTALTYS